MLNKKQFNELYQHAINSEPAMITKSIKLERYECLTGNLAMNKMIVKNGPDIYFVAYCKKGEKAKETYLPSLGAARLQFEILKTKII